MPYDGGLPGRRNAAEQVPRGSKEKRVHLNPGIHRAHVAQRLEVGVQARRAGGGGPRGHAEYITPTRRRSSQAERTRILQGATRGSRGRSTQRSSGMMPFSARCGEYVLPAMKETCLARSCRRRRHGQIFAGVEQQYTAVQNQQLAPVGTTWRRRHSVHLCSTVRRVARSSRSGKYRKLAPWQESCDMPQSSEGWRQVLENCAGVEDALVGSRLSELGESSRFPSAPQNHLVQIYDVLDAFV